MAHSQPLTYHSFTWQAPVKQRNNAKIFNLVKKWRIFAIVLARIRATIVSRPSGPSQKDRECLLHTNLKTTGELHGAMEFSYLGGVQF